MATRGNARPGQSDLTTWTTRAVASVSTQSSSLRSGFRQITSPDRGSQERPATQSNVSAQAASSARPGTYSLVPVAALSEPLMVRPQATERRDARPGHPGPSGTRKGGASSTHSYVVSLERMMNQTNRKLEQSNRAPSPRPKSFGTSDSQPEDASFEPDRSRSPSPSRCRRAGSRIRGGTSPAADFSMQQTQSDPNGKRQSERSPSAPPQSPDLSGNVSVHHSKRARQWRSSSRQSRQSLYSGEGQTRESSTSEPDWWEEFIRYDGGASRESFPVSQKK